MTRSSLRVRPAHQADLPALLALGDELRDQLLTGGEGRRGPAAARSGLQARYVEALADRRRHVVVVVDGPPEDEEVLGMALLTVAPTNALLDQPAVHLNHAVVADRHRRRGAGRALVSAAASFADERGLEQVVVSVHPGSREANRFFARLGFAPMAVRRSATVAVIRRRLQTGGARAGDPAVRRRLRPARGPRASAPLRSCWPSDTERRDVERRDLDRRVEARPLPE